MSFRWFKAEAQRCNFLQVSHVGDALAEETRLEDNFSGLIVDLFASGKIIAPLEEVSRNQTHTCTLLPKEQQSRSG